MLFFTVFRIRIHFLRIRIQDFFPNPDPDLDPGYRIRIQAKNPNYFKRNNKILGKFFVFNPKSRYFIFVFNQSSTSILLNREHLFGIIF